MGFIGATKTCLANYFKFSGRASRPEYWWFILFLVLGSIVLSLIDAAVFGTGSPGSGAEAGGAEGGDGPLSSLFQLAMLIPSLAAGWRRMHDTGRPGWYLFLPVLWSFAMALAMILGVAGIAGFEALEGTGPSPGEAQGAVAFIGLVGVVIAVVAWLVLVGLTLFWLTRPSEPGPNRFGPVPER